MTNDIQGQISAALAAIAARPQLNNLFFVACGGSFAQMHVPKYAIDREARTLVADAYNAAEFVMRNHPRLGPASVVVLCSSSGNTPETVAAARFARERGAYTIGLTTKPESPLARAVDCSIGYEFQPMIGSPDAPAAILLRLAFGILRDREQNPRYDALMRSLPALAQIVSRAQEAHAAEVVRWSAASKRESVIYTMASGPNYGVAYSFAICILQEMQWIHSQAIHAGEYFHGPFEITDGDVSFIALKGTGPCRAMDERAVTFARKFSDRVLVLDAAAFDTSGIEPEVWDFMQPLVFLPVLRMFAIRLSEERGHPLTVRRYMWKMDY